MEFENENNELLVVGVVGFWVCVLQHTTAEKQIINICRQSYIIAGRTSSTYSHAHDSGAHSMAWENINSKPGPNHWRNDSRFFPVGSTGKMTWGCLQRLQFYEIDNFGKLQHGWVNR